MAAEIKHCLCEASEDWSYCCCCLLDCQIDEASRARHFVWAQSCDCSVHCAAAHLLEVKITRIDSICDVRDICRGCGWKECSAEGFAFECRSIIDTSTGQLQSRYARSVAGRQSTTGILLGLLYRELVDILKPGASVRLVHSVDGCKVAVPGVVCSSFGGF